MGIYANLPAIQIEMLYMMNLDLARQYMRSMYLYFVFVIYNLLWVSQEITPNNFLYYYVLFVINYDFQVQQLLLHSHVHHTK